MISEENSSTISARQTPVKDPSNTRQNSLRATVNLTLTDQAALGLFFIQRYRFLTIDQFARASGLLRKTAANQLWRFETHGFLGHFGNKARHNILDVSAE